MSENHIRFSWSWAVTVTVHFMAVYLGCQMATIAVWFISQEPDFRDEMRFALQEKLDKSTFESSMAELATEIATEIEAMSEKLKSVKCKCGEREHHTPFQDSCYFLSPTTKNWTDARDDCLLRKGNLIKVSSEDEFDFLKRITLGKDVWIGLSVRGDGKTWKWEAGGTIHNVNASRDWWANGQPNDENQKCALIEKAFYPLNDRNCSKTYQYLCEIPLEVFVN